MRYIVHGAGALGSLIGGRLAESGAEVVLVGRRPHVEAINQQGLTILLPEGQRRIGNISAVESLAEIAPRPDDLIFLTVKTGATAAAVQELRERFEETTPVFCLQNGVRNEELAARRFLHVYGIMAGLCATLLEPGVVAQTLHNDIALGGYPLGCEELGQAVADRLRRAGFNVTTHESIMAVKWSKLVLNLNNATLAIIDRHLQLATATPAIARFMADVEEEALHVLETAGISLEDPDNPYHLPRHIAELRHLVPDPEKIDEAERLPIELRAYPSTWTDLYQQRGETEAGFFNGEIILLGEKHAIPTPLNSTLLNVVENMAVEQAPPGRYTLDELMDLVEQRRLMLYHD